MARSRPRPRRDPIAQSPHDRLSPAGTVFEPHVAHRERGFVVSSDSRRDVYRVRTNSGRIQTMGRIRTGMGDNDRIPNGTPVVVDHSLGAPYINGILPLETVDPIIDNPATVTDTEGHGGQDPVLARNMLINGRAAGEPDDILPGDFVRTTADGAAIAALHGKVGVLKGSPLAQVRCYGESDSVDLIAGRLRIITWMGESRYLNEDGKTSYEWRGGSDQITQTGADEEHYTMHVDAGHTGGAMRVKLTTPRGQSLFEFHVNPQGKLTVYAKGGFDQMAGASTRRVDGDDSVEVAGTRRVEVTGEMREVFTAGRATEISDSDTKIVGKDEVLRINRDRDENVGGLSSTVVTGNCSLRSAEGHIDTVIDKGDYSVIASEGEMLIKADQGNIQMEPTAGKFKVKTGNSDSVELGDSPGSHGTKYEELKNYMDTFVDDYNQFKSSVKNHGHGVVNTSGTAVAQTGNVNSSNDLSSLQDFNGDLSPAKSDVVKLQ